MDVDMDMVDNVPHCQLADLSKSIWSRSWNNKTKCPFGDGILCNTVGSQFHQPTCCWWGGEPVCSVIFLKMTHHVRIHHVHVHHVYFHHGRLTLETVEEVTWLWGTGTPTVRVCVNFFADGPHGHSRNNLLQWFVHFVGPENSSEKFAMNCWAMVWWIQSDIQQPAGSQWTSSQGFGQGLLALEDVE